MPKIECSLDAGSYWIRYLARSGKYPVIKIEIATLHHGETGSYWILYIQDRLIQSSRVLEVIEPLHPELMTDKAAEDWSRVADA